MELGNERARMTGVMLDCCGGEIRRQKCSKIAASLGIR